MKIINVEKYYNLDSGSYIFSDFYETSTEKVALILQSNKQTKNSESAIAKLLENFQKEFYKKPGGVKTRMEQTFLGLHWKLASLVHKQKTKFNISALLLVLKNNTLYLVQAGRLCAVTFNKQTEFVGLKVKQLIDVDESINMLGKEDDNLTYKVFSHELQPGTRVTIQSVFSGQRLKKAKTKDEFTDILDKLIAEKKYPMFNFSVPQRTKLKSSPFFSITTVFSFRLLMVVVILASFYALLGKKWIQGWISSGKEFVNEKKVQNIDINRILRSDQDLLLVTADKLPQLDTITQAPSFDARHLFLVSNNKIVSVQKDGYKLFWEKKFSNKIISVKLLRNNMMFLLDDLGKQFLLNRTNGEVIWQKETELSTKPQQDKVSELVMLDYIKDSRLDKNYYVTVIDSTIKIYSTNSGDLINEKQFSDSIDHISDYDYIQKCFFVVIDNEILKLKLNIE